MVSQFDFYDCGGLTVTFLGFAEINSRGDVNTSMFNGRRCRMWRIYRLSQSTKDIVFCGTFTAGGLRQRVRKP